MFVRVVEKDNLRQPFMAKNISYNYLFSKKNLILEEKNLLHKSKKLLNMYIEIIFFSKLGVFHKQNKKEYF